MREYLHFSNQKIGQNEVILSQYREEVKKFDKIIQEKQKELELLQSSMINNNEKMDSNVSDVIPDSRILRLNNKRSRRSGRRGRK